MSTFVDRSRGPEAKGWSSAGDEVLRDECGVGRRSLSSISLRPNGERHRLEVQRPIDQLNAILPAWRSSSGRVAEL